MTEKEKSSIGSAFVDKLTLVAGTMSTNRYIVAIRDAFSYTIPITIAAAVFVLVNNVLLAEGTGFLAGIPFRKELSDLCIQGYNGTLGMLGLMLTFLLGANLGKTKGSDGFLEGIIALACYVTLIPNEIGITGLDGTEVSAAGVLTQTFTSSTTMLLGLIAAVLGVGLLGKLSEGDRFKITMPDTVPPAVAKSFGKLMPGFLTVLVFAAAEVAISSLSGMSVPDMVVKVLQAPLIGGFQSLGGIMLYVFLATFVFVFGIHGAFVFGAISSPILLTSLQQNIDAATAGGVLPNIVTQPFLDCYVYMGGGGTMICLVIALLLFSRRKDERMIAKIGGVPSLFNISEPIMFGLPVCFNPVYAIPFCIVPLLSTLIAYLATAAGLVAKTYAIIPWVTPPLLSGFLATGGDFRASVLQLVIIVVGVLVYTPFVLASNKIEHKREQEAQA